MAAPQTRAGAGECAHDDGGEHAHDEHGLAATAFAIGRMQRRRLLRRILLALVFAVALGTVAAEIGLRAAAGRGSSGLGASVDLLAEAGFFAPLDDPLLRYALRPGAQVTVAGVGYRVSSQGTRGEDVPAAKPAGEHRLLVLGGTLAFAPGEAEEATLGARLARLADEREVELGTGLRWRAVNLGVPGYHVGQIQRTLEIRARALAPDAVLVVLDEPTMEHTGFFLDRTGAPRRDFLPLPRSLRRVLWRWSALYAWIATRHAGAVLDLPGPGRDPRSPLSIENPEVEAHARNALRKLAQDGRAGVAGPCALVLRREPPDLHLEPVPAELASCSWALSATEEFGLSYVDWVDALPEDREGSDRELYRALAGRGVLP